jgi:hypothetical protein
VFGAGCSGPSGVPALGAQAGSLPRLGQTLTLRLTNIPASPFNVPFGILSTEASAWNGNSLPVSLDPYGFTGCQAWIAPQVSYVLVNNNGTASWGIPVPIMPRLVGLDVYMQGAVLVPSWNPGGLVFSNAGHGVIGTY